MREILRLLKEWKKRLKIGLGSKSSKNRTLSLSLK